MLLETPIEHKIIINQNNKNSNFNIFSTFDNDKTNINNYDFTEIYNIIFSNDINQLIFFLKSGKNPNVSNNLGETPLFICVKLDNMKALNILLKYGANINFQNNDGNSPLHIAIDKNKENIINLLLENKADPNLINITNFQTPFHLAIINKVNQNILNKLKDKEVDWNIKDKFNKTPFDYALELKDNNYLLLLNNIFGEKENNGYLGNVSIDDEMNETYVNNFKSLPTSSLGNYNILNEKMKYNEEQKENNNNKYNQIGDIYANRMSERYTTRVNKSLNQKININDNILKNSSLSESNNKNDFLNEKKNKWNLDLNLEPKKNIYQNDDNKTKDIIKKIFMITIKKINSSQASNKKLYKKKLDLDKGIINNFKIKKLSKTDNSYNKELSISETNNFGSTFLDETELNSNIINKNELENSLFIDKKINNNEDNKILDIIDNFSHNDNLNLIKDSFDYNNNKEKNYKEIKKDNIKYNDMKYMIIQQIKDKNKKLEIGSPLNISNEILSNLRAWLISCDLLCYYNLLIEHKVYNIDEIILKMKNKKIEVNYKYLEELGIKKPGHIFRFLLKLQIDSEILNKKLCNFIFEKYCNNNSTIKLISSSLNDAKCCGISCYSHNSCPSVASDNISNINNNDIFTFLRNKDLFEFKDNFVHNGFDQVDYIIIQLFSDFKFDKNMMSEYFHIYLENSQEKIIKKLYEEKEKISNEFNIPFDKNEIKDILYSSNDDYLMNKENKKECFIY